MGWLDEETLSEELSHPGGPWSRANAPRCSLERQGLSAVLGVTLGPAR